tara:strand:+ start:105 stop:299 length:195 start_codon:yes stop_codon:yes gene_type:complete
MPGGKMNTENETNSLPTHVAVCQERYKSLESRLARIEKILWWWGTMIVTGLVGIIIKLTFISGG